MLRAKFAHREQLEHAGWGPTWSTKLRGLILAAAAGEGEDLERWQNRRIPAAGIAKRKILRAVHACWISAGS